MITLPACIKKILPFLGVKKVDALRLLTGGCIHTVYHVSTPKGEFCVKYAPHLPSEYFKAEEKGLYALEAQDLFRVPKVVYRSSFDEGGSFLVLEYIPMLQGVTKQEEFGRYLALMHQSLQGKGFGFSANNFLGSTLQKNQYAKDWPSFFREQRLLILLEMLRDDELSTRGARLFEIFETFFENIDITPCLVHGDLWIGNTATDADGRFVLYDPAVYYAHHEVELSIMRMFGGFTERCFAAYHELWPKQNGFEERQCIYALYHYLNHTVLFGEGYRQRCIELFDRLGV